MDACDLNLVEGAYFIAVTLLDQLHFQEMMSLDGNRLVFGIIATVISHCDSEYQRVI